MPDHQSVPADYVGCMKTGPIQTDPHYRWHEPQHEVLGSAGYFTHAWGSLYIVSGRVAGYLASVPPGMLRFFANEGKQCCHAFVLCWTGSLHS